MNDTAVRELLLQAQGDLEGWRENPPGSLVPTEPDLEQRAFIRISLRARIFTLRQVLDLPIRPTGETGVEDHRDLQRIRDAAVADHIASRAEGQP